MTIILDIEKHTTRGDENPIGSDIHMAATFVRRRAKRDALLFAFGLFFRQNVSCLGILNVSAISLQAYFSEAIQNFKTRTAAECPFRPCKKVTKIFRLGNFISFESTIFAKKISRFFFRFGVILPLEPYRTVSK